MSSLPVSPEKRALADALAQVQEHERLQRRAEAEARRPRPSRRPAVLVALATVLVAGAGYLVVARPKWFVAPPPPAESAAVREASVRMAMYATAKRLELYRRDHGALPDSLAQLAIPPAGITYRRTGDAWSLHGVDGALRLTLTSADTLERFVGESYRVLARRSGR